MHTGLIIDTSGSINFIGLTANHKWTQLHLLKDERGASSTLMSVIESMKPPSLDFIGVGIGPGSYTGTRAGVITAKTLAYAWNIPLISFCSLEKYPTPKTGPFLVLVDAKSRGYFALDESGTPFILPKEDASSYTLNKEIITEIDPALTHVPSLVLDKYLSQTTACPLKLSVDYTTQGKENSCTNTR